MGSSMTVVAAIVALVVFFFISGVRIIRPTHRGLIERFGKYHRFAPPGFHWIIPGVDRMIQINITEQMVNAEPQEIITNDNLNARVDAQVYFKVKNDEDSVKNSQYNVNNYQYQIVNLARTTLRNIIGTLTLKSANSERDKINNALLETLARETQHWGIEIVRTELKEIDPPKDVQETMNKVVKAENEKIAALDFANAVERQADGDEAAGDQEGRGHQAGQDSRRRRRGRGDPAGQRGGEHVLRRQRPAAPQARGPGEVPEPERQDRRSHRARSSSTSSARWPASCRCPSGPKRPDPRSEPPAKRRKSETEPRDRQSGSPNAVYRVWEPYPDWLPFLCRSGERRSQGTADER